MKKFVLSVFAILLLSVSLIAQNQRVSGTVKSDDGAPLAGVTVIVKGANNGSITDQKGKYTINAPKESILVFSFLGMQSQSIAVDGKSTINVSMKDDAVSVEKVVVTALGISRAEKTLGYSVASVGTDDLDKAREGNILNSLSGKVAGVNIMQNSGTAGGASKIILRGQSSLGSSGQPLFVVDGLPISNATLDFGINGGIDTGSRIGDLSSDDIESMSILKGAAATALYGARAKDGVIIITTKRGSQNMKTSVSVNSSFRFDTPMMFPDYQNEYAAGDVSTGNYSKTGWNGWGPKISSYENQVEDFTGKKVKLEAYPDNVKDFFDVGKTIQNNISIAGGDEKNDFRIGISSHNQKGIVPNNNFDKYNFSFNGGRQFNDRLTARVAASYIRSSSEGRPAQGSNDRNATMSYIMGMPRNMNQNTLENNWITPEGTPYDMGGGATGMNNPYWILNKNKYTDEMDRVMGSISIEYQPIKNLKISNNIGIDFFYDEARRVWAKGTKGNVNGAFNTYNWNASTINNDLIASYDVKINKDFSLKILAGNNVIQTTNKILSVDSKDLLLPDIYSYANAEVKTPSNSFSRRRLVGVYGDVGVSYKNIAFMNVTGRNDWSSTMPKSHRSYFYPSVSGSFIFTEVLPKNNVLTFGKIRANYAVVGSDTDPYQLNMTYSPVNSYFLQYLGQTAGKFPHNGLLAYMSGKIYPDPNLEPQKQAAFEIGADLRFFNNMLRLDATYYSNTTTNTIASFDVGASTGYFALNTNAGKITNKGIEITLGATPFRGKFVWDIAFNFAKNNQKVVELGEGMLDYSLTSGYNSLQVKAAVGEAFSLYGIDWERDPNGNIIIDATSGLRKATSSTVNLGKIAPDFTLGIVNSFSYKGFDLGFTIDIKQGGKMFSGTASNLRTTGIAKETLLNDRKPIVDKGVNLVNGEYVPNTTEISAYKYWSQNFLAKNSVANVFDASYAKLRELTLSYTLPRTLTEKWFIQDLSIGFEGRNLWLIHSNVPHIDPELNFFSSSEVGYGVEFFGIPTTRSLGFNIKFKF